MLHASGGLHVPELWQIAAGHFLGPGQVPDGEGGGQDGLSGGSVDMQTEFLQLY